MWQVCCIGVYGVEGGRRWSVGLKVFGSQSEAVDFQARVITTSSGVLGSWLSRALGNGLLFYDGVNRLGIGESSKRQDATASITSDIEKVVSISPSPTKYPQSDSVKMFRTAAIRSARCLAQAAPRAQAPVARRVIQSSFQSRTVAPSTIVPAIRFYSAHAGLSQDEVQGRILDLLKNFDKVRGVRDART